MAGNGNGKKGDVVGAVMVVGGGIAGIQSSLDLAEAGYKVYLVEEESAIGGHMAQLDKTFPTNDCAMCTISPKLVEVGRHLNIDILTGSDVLKLDGEAGDFTATIRRRPRYVDLDKCTACGECTTVCPVSLPNTYNEGLADKMAIDRLYPQAIPDAPVIEKLGVAPCRDACPIEQRAQGYIALIKEKRYYDALISIKRDNPFPSVCGRTCHHPCESSCNRARVDGRVGIMALKRFATDYVYENGRPTVKPVEQTHSERVAVIGSGPTGLTAAHDLVKMGYPVTVFEALPVAGGLMKTVIPNHRLPKDILQNDIDDIIALGVDLRLNSPVEDPAKLLKEGYTAVFVAVGIYEKAKLNIDGEELDGVLSAVDMLRQMNLNETVTVGKRVAVIGSGIVAVDAASASLRLGAEEVYLFLNRPKGEVPAYQWEVDEAVSEGVHLLKNYAVARITADENQNVTGVEYAEAKRKGTKMEAVAGTEVAVEVDTVIRAVGRSSGISFLDAEFESLANNNKETLETGYPGIFTGGSKGFVVNAIALGHQASAVIGRYLRSEPLPAPEKPAVPVAKWSRAEAAERIEQDNIQFIPPVYPALLPLNQRHSFQQIMATFTEEEALAEAARCLDCGICSECMACVDICGTGAIFHEMVETVEELNVGAAIIAPGYQAYQAGLSEEYGWGRFPNVITSLQLERLLNASGPTTGHVKRISDGKAPKKVAFLQCVGSRNQTHDYCSSVCCMYAAKEAVMVIEHEPGTEVHIFMMDMRSFSKGYEEYYNRAREKYGVKYTRCRISNIKENPATNNLILRYADHPNRSNGGGKMVEEEFDMVVLSVGMGISDGVKDLGRRLEIELDDYGFCKDISPFQPLETSRAGVYAAGTFRGPKDIPDTVIEASGAAALAGGLLAAGQGKLVTPKIYPEQRNIVDEEPRIGVFVCHCGTNIGGYLDVPDVTEYAKTLPGVVHSEQQMFACSQDSIQRITKETKEKGLNRVVVASCTPLTHGPLFESSIREAGLNEHLCEMANIRNHCSWIHSDDWEGATEKAKELVCMAVARSRELESLEKIKMPIDKDALVIGGGVAGMNAALNLAAQGLTVHLIERADRLGGNLWNVHYTEMDVSEKMSKYGGSTGSGVTDVRGYLLNLIERVEADQYITTHMNTDLVAFSGYKGNFTSVINTPEGELEVKHGATVVATGGVEYKGDEYGYGADSRIMTQQEFEALLAGQPTNGDANGNCSCSGNKNGNEKSVVSEQDLSCLTGADIKNIVMVLCVGPADKYCGRICCSTAMKNILKLKQLNPSAQITVFFKDIRTYGFKERAYTEAREKGVIFVHYTDDRPPVVSGVGELDSPLTVTGFEPILQREMKINPDLVILSTPIVPSEGNKALATALKVPVDMDGFFLEAHIKLRPVDFVTEGIYMAGLAHYPKFLDETIVQAQAAAARAITILSKDEIEVGGVVAFVDQHICVGCLTCLRVCPYGVPQISADFEGIGGIIGAAIINPAECQGCGICAADCPAQAIQLTHYQDDQMEVKITALLDPLLLSVGI